MSQHIPGPWWPDDNGCVAAGSGDSYVTIADLNCNDLPADERAKNQALIAAAPAIEAVLEACLQALKDASGVVDAGEDEEYAYQHEIAQAEAALALVKF